MAEKAASDAINTLDHVGRTLHKLAADHAQGLGIPDEFLQGGVRDVAVRLLASPILVSVCATRSLCRPVLDDCCIQPKAEAGCWLTDAVLLAVF